MPPVLLGLSKLAVRRSLIEPLQQARSLLQETRDQRGSSLEKLVELSLHGFILKAKAHANQEVRAARSRNHVARAHAIRALLTDPPLAVALGADVAHQKNP
jgi:hypothetical protein